MKRLIFTVLMCVTASSWAQHGWHRYQHHHHHHYHSRSADWIFPAIIGGAVVYAATRPVAPPPPVVIYVPQGLPLPPAGFRYEQILDAGCNCHRWVLVQGQ